MSTQTVTTTSRITRWKDERILNTFVPETRRRGGETSLTGKYGTTRLSVEHRAQGLVLLTAHGWRMYSRSFGARSARLAYLCGVDDNGIWAARVPGSCETVSDALAKLTPAEVKGREHVRQGDMYLARLAVRGRTSESGVYNDTHLWDAETRTLTHVPEEGAAHAPVTAPADWPSVKVVEQLDYASNRGWTAD
ncbi:hypothetical protein [Georgenia yuyongxinii]|uniref:Uncharacterized protein n=1 Tax=Georgenia yuyongxinii TaxID=2589797 RepID=A0A552WU74_9MICO|nr:hypothetical protein [Georgenia yuyongxinii]TRW46398.1 hypothetical protein FJ693_05580 [Georgenia yuyongxinii]